MDRKWRDKWVKALRSGKFRQTQGRLQDGNAYCCLGVLCHLVDPKKRFWRDDDIVLPFQIVNKVGLDIDRSPLHRNDPILGRRLTASMLNDRGKSFSEIADRIEKYL